MLLSLSSCQRFLESLVLGKTYQQTGVKNLATFGRPSETLGRCDRVPEDTFREQGIAEAGLPQ